MQANNKDISLSGMAKQAIPAPAADSANATDTGTIAIPAPAAGSANATGHGTLPTPATATDPGTPLASASGQTHRRRSAASPYPLLTDDPKRAAKAFTARDMRLEPLRLAADTLTDTVARVLSDPARFYRFAVREEDGEIAGIDTRVIKELAGTLKELGAAVRNLHDIPTDADRQGALIAAGKYRLLEQKSSIAADDKTALRVLFGEDEADAEDLAVSPSDAFNTAPDTGDAKGQTPPRAGRKRLLPAEMAALGD